MKLKIFLFVLILTCTNVFAQHQTAKNDYVSYGRWVVDTLSSPYFYGRGYLNEGMRNASFFIATEMFKMKLDKYPEALNYYQNFDYSINTFPHNIYLSFDDYFLTAGKDYLPGPGNTSLKGEFSVIKLDSSVLSNPAEYAAFSKKDFSKSVILVDEKGITSKEAKQVLSNINRNPFGAKAIIKIKDKILMPVRQDTSNVITFDVQRDAVKQMPSKVRISIQNEFVPAFKAANLVGGIQGSEKPDSFIVFVAHYDHVGGLGQNVYFPGANDNASGTAMLLSLAKYYSQPQNRPKYSMLFIAFAGEEAGLLGSRHYVMKSPVKPLDKIKFLVNLDMVGTGDEGISVVNGKKHEQEFQLLDSLAKNGNYFESVIQGGPAANSDHYYFTEKGVPAFFIFTRGGIQAYHDVYDKRETLPLTKFAELHELLTKFVEALYVK